MYVFIAVIVKSCFSNTHDIQVQEAVKCINIIAALNTKCTTDASGRVFHKCGNTVIIGQSAAPPSNFPTISSPWYVPFVESDFLGKGLALMCE